MNSKSSIILLVSVLIAFIVGIFIDHTFFSQTTLNKSNSQTNTDQTNSFFQSQSATVQGKITNISGSKITVINNSGESKTFTVFNKIIIYKFTTGANQASSSSNLNTIDKDRAALLTLRLINGEYQIVSISYLPSISPAPTKK